MELCRDAKLSLALGLCVCNATPVGEPGTETGAQSTGVQSTGVQSTGDDSTTELSTGTGDPTPVEANVIFVTSTVHDGNLGGIEGADAECNARAAAAGLSGEYVAWLSTASFDAIDRIAGSRGWIRPDGRAFADELAADPRKTWYPPALDEFGEVVPDDTRTISGTDFLGLFMDLSGTCEDYTSSAALGGVGAGNPFAGVGEWSSGGTYACHLPMRMSCLGIGLNVPLAIPPPSGRLAFVSTPVALTGGVAAADDQCQAEADTNGLAGSFRALLATSGGTAASRFALDGLPWYRLDGAQIFASAAELVTGRPLAPVLQQANGTSAASMMRLGAPTPGSPSDGACDDWTGTVGESMGGSSRMIGALAYGGMTHSCAQAIAHYCLQE